MQRPRISPALYGDLHNYDTINIMIIIMNIQLNIYIVNIEHS